MKRFVSLAIVLAMLLMVISVAVADDASYKGDAFAGYPIQTNETLRLWTNGLGYHSDYISEDESPYHQWLEEATGVDIIWERPAAGANATQAYNLMIATGDLPDIIYKGSLPSECETMIDDGIFLVLDDYMEDYAPSLYAFLQSDPDTTRAVLSDSGHYYCFPFIRENVDWLGRNNGPTISMKMLEEVGMEKPVTIDDWDKALHAFVELDDCDIVLTGTNATRPRSAFGNAFGFQGNARYYVDEEGKAATWMNAAGYKDFLTLMHQWYVDGIIDPDFATLDLMGFVAKFVANRCGAAVYGSATPARFYLQILERDGEWEYEATQYAVANEGDPVLFPQGEALWTETGAVITTACENIGLAMRFLDYGYTKEGIELWNYGKEGESFYRDDAGNPHVMDSIINAEEGTTLALSRYTSMTGNGISIMSIAWNQEKQGKLANDMVDMWSKNAADARLHFWPPVCASIEENSELSTIESAVTTYADEMYLNFIIGTESLDNYDQYLANLENLGISRVLEIKQVQLDRYNARN